MKRYWIICLLACSLQAQSLLVCGVPPNGGCSLVSLGIGLKYDAATKSITASIPAQSQPQLYKLVVDTFQVNCQTISGCPNGVPQTIFKTSQPVKQFLLAFRAITQSEGPTMDYTKIVNADGSWTVTFNTASDPGTVILFYLAPCPVPGGCQFGL